MRASLRFSSPAHTAPRGNCYGSSHLYIYPELVHSLYKMKFLLFWIIILVKVQADLGQKNNLVIYATFLLKQPETNITRPIVPTLKCKVEKQCRKSDFTKRYFNGDYRHMSVEALKAKVSGCRCRVTLDKVICNARLLLPNIIQADKKADAHTKPSLCRKFCDIQQQTGKDLFYLVDEPQCSIFSAVESEHYTLRLSNDVIDYDAKQMILSNVKPSIGKIAPYSANLTSNNILFDARTVMSHNSTVAVISDEAAGMQFIRTDSTSCELVLLHADHFVFTGNNFYYEETYFDYLMAAIPLILTFPDSIQGMSGYKIMHKAVNFYLKSSTQEIAIMCDRLTSNNVCKHLPTRPGEASEDCLRRAAQLGIIFGKDQVTNRTMAAKCTVEKQELPLSEITTKQNITYHEEKYWLVQGEVDLRFVIRNIELDFFLPQVITLSRGDQLAVFSTVRTNLTEMQFFDSIKISDLDLEVPIPFIPREEVVRKYGEETLSKLRQIGDKILDTFAFWALGSLVGLLVAYVIIMRVISFCLTCTWTEKTYSPAGLSKLCQRASEAKTSQAAGTAEVVESGNWRQNARDSILTEDGVANEIVKLEKEYNSLFNDGLLTRSQLGKVSTI